VFKRCVLRLTQADRWLKVILYNAKPLHAPDINNAEETAAWAQMIAQFPIEGQWKVGENSVTNKAEQAYTIGSSSPPQAKYWRWGMPQNSGTATLQFVESTKWVGGGLGFGQVYDQTDVSLELYGVKITDAAAEAIDPSRARGSVYIGSNILRPSPSLMMDVLWEVDEWDIVKTP
jgi:hypothetical protein